MRIYEETISENKKYLDEIIHKNPSLERRREIRGSALLTASLLHRFEKPYSLEWFELYKIISDILIFTSSDYFK